MSPREWRFLIDDILEAIERIQRYVAGMSPEELEDDDKTVDAVVRNLIIIGEAAAHVPSDVAARRADIPWRLMGDMRNFVVHQYWGVDTAVLWKTVCEDLPPLTRPLQELKSS